jgi:hypothetical protein
LDDVRVGGEESMLRQAEVILHARSNCVPYSYDLLISQKFGDVEKGGKVYFFKEDLEKVHSSASSIRHT